MPLLRKIVIARHEAILKRYTGTSKIASCLAMTANEPIMPKINFFTEDVNYTLKGKTAIKKWITETISTEDYQLNELNFIFCSDEYLLRVNQDFLQHDYYTDVITFDNSEALKTILGDIFISIDRVKDNAKQNNAAVHDELCRIMIHGTLHLLGYKDKTKKAKIEMTDKEDFYLAKRI